MTEHNKLVRDRIPAKIDAGGREVAIIRTLDPSELRKYLREKLREESNKAYNAVEPFQLLVELVDIQDVIDATLKAWNFDRATFDAERKGKNEECGGFERRVLLIRTEARP